MSKSNRPTPVTLTVYSIGKKGEAFARIDNGETVYIPAAVAHASGLKEGYITTGLILPNNRPRATTEWFCPYAEPTLDVIDQTSRDLVMSVLKDGDAWTAADMAEETGLTVAVAAAVLEQQFFAGHGAKFVRFTSPGAGDLMYYTHYPDRVEVAEFEDDVA